MSKQQHARTQNVSRRTMIKGAAAVTAAAAVGLPAFNALAADAAPAAANGGEVKRLNLGFIGVGKMSSGHLSFFRGRKDIRVVAICDVDQTRREHFVSETNKKYIDLDRKDDAVCVGIVDYKELLARKDIDAVVIGTPDHWHIAILIAAANAKKHIYCEKPLTLTIEEAKLAIEAVQKNGVVMQTGSQQRSEGPFRDVVDYIRNGKLGKLKEVHVAIGGTSKPRDLPNQPVPAGLDWDRWLGQAPQQEYNEILANGGKLPDKYPFNPGWRDYREFSGGHVTDWGAHHIDITQWALSMDEAGPDEILPPEKKGDDRGARLVYRKSPAGDEIVVTHVKEIAGLPDPKNPGKTKAESNGILFVGEKGKIFVSRSIKLSMPESILAAPLSEADKKLPNTGQHRVNWLDCIRNGGKPVAHVEVGARSVTACHLLNLAYWNNQKLKWDPKAWTFTEGTGDNAWISRPRRKGYELPAIG